MNDNNTPEVVVVRLDPSSLDELAHRVADLVHEQLDPPAAATARPDEDEGRLLSAAQVAARWGVDRSWVYDHSDDLGAMRLGTGRRPRLRFDPARVTAYLNPPDHSPDTGANAPPARRRAGSVR